MSTSAGGSESPSPALDDLDLEVQLSKADYKAVLPGLQARLHQLQRACWQEGYGTLILFEGWDLAGKGDCINKLTQRLEPRAFTVNLVLEPRTQHLRMPWLWRFWMTIPRYGQFVIMQQSWYRRVLKDRLRGSVKKKQWKRAFDDIRCFEEMLTVDRYLMIKLFLHIDKQEQRRRLEELSNADEESWRIEEDDWKEHRQYDEHRGLIERMLKETHTATAPWHLIAATDRRWARTCVFETVVGSLERSLQERNVLLPEPQPTPADEADDRYLDGEAGA